MFLARFLNSIYFVALKMQRKTIVQLKYVQRLPAAYDAALVEVSRRRQFDRELVLKKNEEKKEPTRKHSIFFSDSNAFLFVDV